MDGIGWVRRFADARVLGAWLVIGVLSFGTVVGCGEDASVRSSGEHDAVPTEELPKGLSEPYDIAAVATGADTFVVVDGGGGDDGARDSTTFLEVTPGGSTSLDRIDVPLRTPKVWVDGGSVVVVGMECADDEDIGPSCPDAPLTAVERTKDGELTTWRLGVTTDTSVGFAAGPTGTGGIAVVTLDPSTRDAHVAVAPGNGDQAADVGTVDFQFPAATLICAADGRTYLFPADPPDPDSEPAVVELDDGQLEEVGKLADIAGEVRTVSGCSDSGKVLVNSLEGTDLTRTIVDIAHPDEQRSLDLDEPHASGMVTLVKDGRVLAWTMAEQGADSPAADVWELHELTDGTWRAIGEITSSSPPTKTTVSQDASLVIVPGVGGSRIEIL